MLIGTWISVYSLLHSPWVFCSVSWLCWGSRAEGQHWQALSDAGGHLLRQQSLPGKTHTQAQLNHSDSYSVATFQDLCSFYSWGLLPSPCPVGPLQTPRRARPWRPGVGGSLLGLHLRPRQPALDEVQRHQHHRVVVGGAGARLVRRHDQCERLLPDVHRWQAAPPDHRCAEKRVLYLWWLCCVQNHKSRTAVLF